MFITGKPVPLAAIEILYSFDYIDIGQQYLNYKANFSYWSRRNRDPGQVRCLSLLFIVALVWNSSGSWQKKKKEELYILYRLYTKMVNYYFGVMPKNQSLSLSLQSPLQGRLTQRCFPRASVSCFFLFRGTLVFWSRLPINDCNSKTEKNKKAKRKRKRGISSMG